MKPLRVTAYALFVVLALAACGQDGSGRGTTPTPTQTGGPMSVSPTDPPTRGGPASKTPGSPAAGPGSPTTAGTTTLTGTVTAGVEAGCVLLDRYLLVGGPRELLRAGATVTVTGRVQPDLMTTCQQGTPFVVESARAA